jgi:hypothetical protein
VSNKLAELDAILERLVRDAVQERNEAKYDELCSEIWRVLAERDALDPMPIAVKPERKKVALR